MMKAHYSISFGSGLGHGGDHLEVRSSRSDESDIAFEE